MMATKTTALWVDSYYDAGWTLVPLPPRSKALQMKGVTGAGGRDLPKDELLSLLQDESNIGLRMPEGVVGIDVDDYDDKGGGGTLLLMESGIAGLGPSLGVLPDSPRLTSREDGVSGIRFYRVAGGAELRDPGPGVEMIRRSHRYAVAAPSVHPDTGRQYQWIWPGDQVGGPPRVEDLPYLPPAWVAHLRTDGYSRGSRGSWSSMSERDMLVLFRGFADGAPCPSVEEWGAKAMDAATRKLGPAHNALLTPVLNLLRMGYAGCPGAGAALATAFKAYQRLDPAVHTEDFINMVAPAVEDAKADPWSCGPCLQRSMASGLPLPGPGGSTAPTAGGAVADEEVPELGENKYGWLEWNDDLWLQRKPPMLIPGMLAEGGIGILYCRSGQGKSLLMHDVCAGFSVRGRVFGEPVEPITILYVDHENAVVDIVDRLRSMGFGPKDNARFRERLHYSLLGDWPPLDTRAGGEALLAEALRVGAKLVVLDTNSKVVAGLENDNPTWNNLHVHTTKPLKRNGIAVVQLDHTGKDEGAGIRGGSSKLNNVDVAWKLWAEKGDRPGFRTLTCEKDRPSAYGGEGAELALEVGYHPLEHRFTSAIASSAAREKEREDKVEAVAAQLDAMGAPLAGKQKVRAWLEEKGLEVRASNADLQAACSMRNKRGTA